MALPLVFSIIFSSICIISLYLGIYTLYTNPRSFTNRIFLALTTAMFIWSFGFAMAISAADISACLFWRRFAAIGWGTFFSILLQFVVSLTGRNHLPDRWWKYVLLYLPAAVCLSVFTYIPGLNPQQFNLVQTPSGWINVPIKNCWDWFYIAYYLGYTLTGIYFLWKWGRTDSSRNVRKQSNIIILAILAALVLGAFTESAANSVFSVRIPQMAPIVMLIPVMAVSYAMQKYGFLDIRKNMTDSLLFSEQIRKRVVHYLATSLFVSSVLNVVGMYFIYKDTNLARILVFSGVLIVSGVIFEVIERIEKNDRYKDGSDTRGAFLYTDTRADTELRRVRQHDCLGLHIHFSHCFHWHDKQDHPGLHSFFGHAYTPAGFHIETGTGRPDRCLRPCRQDSPERYSDSPYCLLNVRAI
ncbi:MAG TPA: histidine kinase N-terminal 7TM domain-containing protein [Clostridiales bacterium]|nr:histidine kinase N-terminal 7TM domain-containing protein [Clostridiales bacterium]